MALLHALGLAYLAINVLITLRWVIDPEFEEETKDWHWSEHFVEQLIMVCFALLMIAANTEDDDEPKS